MYYDLNMYLPADLNRTLQGDSKQKTDVVWSIRFSKSKSIDYYR